ncbi:unnamed protein product [Brassica rapa]|uniref:Uncharacterized protein n=2 Tax=Brassica TaxID=3705 RepID=A0A8D9HEP3_BRACM|nr:unnamed protein product [Brassica napus]CAG7896466.1 unnamed protein product [Brassica rapa]
MLYSSGASKFVVHNVAPLGSLPIVRQEFNTGNECYEKFNDLAKQHNARLGPMLNELAKAKPGYSFTNISCCGIGSHNVYGAVFLTCTRSYASIKDLIFTSTHVTTQRRHKNHSHIFFLEPTQTLSNPLTFVS